MVVVVVVKSTAVRAATTRHRSALHGSLSLYNDMRRSQDLLALFLCSTLQSLFTYCLPSAVDGR